MKLVVASLIAAVGTVGVTAPTVVADDPLDLQIVHINDHHSHLEEDDVSFDVDGTEVTAPRGGFARVAALIDELVDGNDNAVKLHAGDAVTGTLYYSLFEGQADADAMNEVCFDVFALGNHEFDDSDAGLAQFLDWLAEGDCDTDVVSANVEPAAGTPLADGYFEPYVIEEIGGVDVGFVGLTIAGKTKNSSSPLDSTEFLDEMATAAAAIEELEAAGVDHVVLVTHIGYEMDLAIAAAVPGVDVIVGGDSHTLLGDGYADLGLSPGGPYPTMVDGPDGPVCVAQAWEYSKIVGELDVSFDADGVVTDCTGTPYMPLGDDFTKEVEVDGEDEDVPLEGDELQAAIDFVEANPLLRFVEPDAGVTAVIDGYSGEVDELTQQQIGVATEDLCVGRIPGDGRSELCSVEETAVTGGHIQQIVTECFLLRSFEADIAVQNSGGVRIDIPAGDVTVADAYELLPFSNTMVNLEMTGAEIKTVIEQGAANAATGDSTGAYPYAAGLRWDMDLSAADGSRVSNLEVQPRGATEWTPLDPSATYTVVTNSFAASGGDLYLAFADASDDGRAVDTFLEYAQTFIDCVEDDLDGEISRVADERYSTQSFTDAEGNFVGTLRPETPDTTVPPAPTTTQPPVSSLPKTGSTSGGGALIATALLLAGLGMWVATRRTAHR